MRGVCGRPEEKGLLHSDSGLKKKRGDCSPLSLSHESTAVCQAFSRFTGASRPRKALARSLRLFALRCSPSFGPARRRNANTGMNLAGANRESCFLSRPAETFCAAWIPRNPSSSRSPRCPRSDRLRSSRQHVCNSGAIFGQRDQEEFSLWKIRKCGNRGRGRPG